MWRKMEDFFYNILKPEGQQSQLHDVIEYIISGMILLSVALIIFQSIWESSMHQRVFYITNVILFGFFLIEYIIRIWIADMVLNDRQHPVKSRIRYIFSFWALVDLLALLPIFFGGAIIDFRIFRVLRLFRITKLTSINKYTNRMVEVIRSKGPELLTSLGIVTIYMVASAVIIYDVESKAQPEIFTNVLTSLWWAVATITTIGYGDIYPITPVGKFVASLISIAGMLLMAIPISILTSGFIEQSKGILLTSEEEVEIEEE